MRLFFYITAVAKANSWADEWNNWSHCDAKCGGGERTRTRDCSVKDADCDNPEITFDSEKCNTQRCYWGYWSDWAECDGSCEGGRSSRNRPCERMNEGRDPNVDCFDPEIPSGVSSEETICNPTAMDTPCSGTWLEWEAWQPCDKGCDGGKRTRHRECWNNSTESTTDKNDCFGGIEDESSICNERPCGTCDNHIKPGDSTWKSDAGMTTGRNWELSFSFRVGNLPVQGGKAWGALVDLTTYGPHKQGRDRLPAIYLGDNGLVNLGFRYAAPGKPEKAINADGNKFPVLANLTEWNDMLVTSESSRKGLADWTVITFKLNDEILWRFENHDPQVYNDVFMELGNPYSYAHAEFCNLKFENIDQCNPYSYNWVDSKTQNTCDDYFTQGLCKSTPPDTSGKMDGFSERNCPQCGCKGPTLEDPSGKSSNYDRLFSVGFEVTHAFGLHQICNNDPFEFVSLTGRQTATTWMDKYRVCTQQCIGNPRCAYCSIVEVIGDDFECVLYETCDSHLSGFKGFEDDQEYVFLSTKDYSDTTRRLEYNFDQDNYGSRIFHDTFKITPDKCETNPCGKNAECVKSDSNNRYECKCNAPYAGDGFNCSPCPQYPWAEESDLNCWTFVNDTCIMNDGCSKLTCDSTGMRVKFGENLFGVGWQRYGPSWASEVKPVWTAIDPDGSITNGEWIVDAPLGTNGMTYTIDPESNHINFKLFVALEGNEQRARSDVMGRQIDLGSMSVHTTPFGIGVSYECSYPLLVTVASQELQVTRIESFGSNIGFGDLAGSFAMTLTGASGEDNRFVMGAPMVVSVEWSVKTLSKLTFHYLDCTVAHGETSAQIIKGGCFAGITETHPIESTGTTASFSYEVFKGLGEDSTEQTIQCSIMICPVGKCDTPKTNDECPAAIGDIPYKYQAISLFNEDQ